jgi:hypothetical protein
VKKQIFITNDSNNKKPTEEIIEVDDNKSIEIILEDNTKCLKI